MGITCKQAVDYISKKEEGKLSAAQRFALWRHLAVCSLCRAFNTQNKLLGPILKKRTPDLLPQDKTVDKEAIIDALKKAEE